MSEETAMELLDGASMVLLTYGYWAVLLLVAVESVGIPVPGETMLLSAAIYAGLTHQLNIALVIAAAAVGAILGDNVGYLLGRAGGYRLLHRYGRYIRLDERRLRLGEYLFLRHGGTVVFCGRFVAVLRMWAAFLAGTHRMPWRPFLACNAAGGVVWATLMGLGGYLLGHNVERVAGPVGTALMVLAALVVVGGLVYLHRHEQRLADEAERVLGPGLPDGSGGGATSATDESAA
jgi:membrane protein DedA with SNARE-associated domain